MLVGGTFRRLIDAQIHLRRFEKELAAAGSLEECWEVLQKGCRDFGFAGLKLRIEGREFEQRPAAGSGSGCWAVRVALSDRD